MKRAVVALAAAVALLVPLVAGCGKGSGPDKTDAPQAADQMKAAQAQGMKQGGAGAPGASPMKQGQGKGTPAGN